MKTKTSIMLMAGLALMLGAGCRKGGDPGVGAGGATTRETDAQVQQGNTSGSGSAPNTTSENSGAAGPATAGATTSGSNATDTAGTDSAGRPAGSAGGNTEPAE